MNEESTEILSATLGLVEQVVGSDEDREGKNCVRVRIKMDITSPLCRGRKIKLEGGKMGWIYFQYE